MNKDDIRRGQPLLRAPEQREVERAAAFNLVKRQVGCVEPDLIRQVHLQRQRRAAAHSQRQWLSGRQRQTGGRFLFKNFVELLLTVLLQ